MVCLKLFRHAYTHSIQRWRGASRRDRGGSLRGVGFRWPFASAFGVYLPCLLRRVALWRPRPRRGRGFGHRVAHRPHVRRGERLPRTAGRQGEDDEGVQAQGSRRGAQPFDRRFPEGRPRHRSGRPPRRCPLRPCVRQGDEDPACVHGHPEGLGPRGEGGRGRDSALGNELLSFLLSGG